MEKKIISFIKTHKIIIIIILAALLVRLIYLFALSKSPLFDWPVMDPKIHDDWAYAMAGSEGAEDTKNMWALIPYFRAPLYPMFLSIFYSIFGRSNTTYVVMRLFQFILGVYNVFIIYLIGRKFTGDKTAITAGIIAALYWPFIYFEGELLIPALLLPLTLTAFYLLIRAVAGENLILYLVSGIFFGLCAITRPNILIFFPALFFWIVYIQWKKSNRITKRILPALMITVGIAICIAPVTIRNYVVSKDLVLIASQAGVNFYIGNNEMSDGRTAVVPGTRASWWGGYEDTIRIAEKETGKQLKPSAVSRFWFKKGWDFIKKNPGLALKQSGNKLRFFFNNIEISNNQNIYFFRNYTGIINLPFFIGFWLLAPFGLAGLIFMRKKPYWGIMVLFSGIYCISVILFFVNGRYRLPIIPFLIIFAAALIIELIELIKAKKFKPLSIRLTVIAALFIILKVSALPMPLADPNQPSDGHFVLANVYAQKKEHGKAYALYTQTTALNEPYRSRSYHYMGGIDLMENRLPDAVNNFRQALSANPKLKKEVMERLVVLNHEALMENIFFNPGSSTAEKADYYVKLGDLLINHKKFPVAYTYYKKAVAHNTRIVSAYINLGLIERMNPTRLEYALEYFNEGLRYTQGHPLLTYYLAETYFMQGQRETAEKIVTEQLLALDPNNKAFHELLRKIQNK